MEEPEIATVSSAQDVSRAWRKADGRQSYENALPQQFSTSSKLDPLAHVRLVLALGLCISRYVCYRSSINGSGTETP